jgi:glc operon protein GlcG
MISKPALTHADVDVLLAAAKAEALRQNWAVTIAVVDDGGHLLGLQRLDGAPVFTTQMATEKARSAALGRRESKKFEEVIAGGRVAFLTVPGLKGLLEGGVPIIHQGQVAGAVGVSGVKSSEDAQVARAAIAALLPNG